MFKVVLVLSILVMSFQTFARGGDELLNGGDGLVCAYGEVKTYELLDLHEGTLIYGLSYESAASVENALNRVFTYLRKKDNARSCLYSRWLRTFWDESRLIYSAFPNIRDEGYHTVHPNCWVEQVAIRTFRALPSNTRYLISGKIYNKMSNLDKAALIMHELVYREARLADRKNFSNSQHIRKYVAYLFSKSMRDGSQEQYDQVVESVGLPTSEKYCDPMNKVYKTP
ncbi:hypothetical protein [Bdellovibrio sp. HCB2-146]|uniref:hypothetical protein n=1 Tax=Bdellovibrio sp. HCB2-146 TaxID=3394362 RepID=UPI0039BC34A9